MPFLDTRSLPVVERLPGWHARYFHSASMTFAHYEFKRGASIHEHFHEQEEVYEVIEGELEMTIEGETNIARPGIVAIVPSGAHHSVKALTDGRAIIVDYPIRAMTGEEDILAQLIEREPIFHRPEFGATRAGLEKMTVPDYWQIGASGQRYDREFVLDTVTMRFAAPMEENLKASGFECRKLAENVYLLTYNLLQDGTRRTRRSTIWQRATDGWKIVFHQGTIIQES